MSKADVQKLVERLGGELEIPGLTLDENGYCCLMFDDLSLNIETDAEGLLFVYSHIGRIPAQDKEIFYQKLLEANYFYQQTGGGTIGIDAGQGIVVLIMQTPGSVLQDESFRKMLENFVNIAHTWAGRITEFAQGGGGPVDSSGFRPLPGSLA